MASGGELPSTSYAGSERIPQMEPYKLFISKLSPGTDQYTIATYFKAFGAVEQVKLVKSLWPGKSRGYAFVTFRDPASVQRVLAHPYHFLDNSPVIVKPVRLSLPEKEI